jgi:hypothetical protein
VDVQVQPVNTGTDLFNFIRYLVKPIDFAARWNGSSEDECYGAQNLVAAWEALTGGRRGITQLGSLHSCSGSFAGVAVKGRHLQENLVAAHAWLSDVLDVPKRSGAADPLPSFSIGP